MTIKERIMKLSGWNPPQDGSKFHDEIIRGSIPHTKRNDPAWVYSIRDATHGASLEHHRLKPIIEQLAELVDVLHRVAKDENEIWLAYEIEDLMKKLEVESE